MGSAMAHLVGNVASEPKKALDNPGHERVSFRVLATERRPDGAGGWMDGDQFGITVVCWGGLAKGAATSVRLGDPVVVTGKLVNRRYEQDGEMQYSTELKASQVGHDLSRGKAVFSRASSSATDPGVDSAEPKDDTAELAVIG